MSAEVLRAAAQLIRAEQTVEHVLGHIDDREFETWLAVADWLDEYARVWELTDNADADMQLAPIGRHALTVARAYLGETA